MLGDKIEEVPSITVQAAHKQTNTSNRGMIIQNNPISVQSVLRVKTASASCGYELMSHVNTLVN